MLKTINNFHIPFIIMFFAETTYYLLILQTGIVEFYNSDMQVLWMIPVGGVIGIILTFILKNYQNKILSISLFLQIFLVSFYPDFSHLTLFLLGLLSGLIAPILIYQISNFKTIFIILSLSYVAGTFGTMIEAGDRFYIAIALSLLAFLASIFVDSKDKDDTKLIPLVDFVVIFSWLLLDSTLFESLSRDTLTIWKNSEFVWIIALSHVAGLALAYKLHNYKNVNYLIIVLFALSYLFYTLELQYPLSVIYPVVISFYNVIILKRFIQLPFLWLCFGAIGLWVSAGTGLLIALNHLYILGWFILVVLLLLQNKTISSNISRVVESTFKHTSLKDIK